MPRQTKVPLAHRRALNKALTQDAVPPAALRLSAGAWVRTLRAALHMTQAQLAERAGLTQAHVALIENGKIDPQLGTLKALFDALFCDCVLLPVPRARPGDIVAQRVKEVARDKREEETMLAQASPRLWDRKRP
jgi:transcriptional regulator with XRE-family HTH domain